MHIKHKYIYIHKDERASGTLKDLKVYITKYKLSKEKEKYKKKKRVRFSWLLLLLAPP